MNLSCRIWLLVAVLTCLLDLSSAAAPTGLGESALFIELPDGSAQLQLRGSDDRRQLLVTRRSADTTLSDCTRDVGYSVTPAGIVAVDGEGQVKPLGNGSAVIEARSADGLTATQAVRVEDYGKVLPVNFPNQIVPIFTKAGCNAGGCHGKASGQNGFRLSLLGFEPEEDYEHLVKEARGRRLFPAAPPRSLLLQKATAAVPHGGGKRLEPGSQDYEMLLRWISQGMPYGKKTDPVIARIEVFPKARTLALGAQQQLVVTAHYTDGSCEDVTRSALYEPNDKDLAEMVGNGRLKVYQQPGDVAVMVRYQAKVAVFRATLPLPHRLSELPAPNNFIDQLVFKKLEALGLPPSDLADDQTFLRRVTIDIAGRLPTAAEADRFMADSNPAKRQAWIDRLLDSAEYADYFANKWSALLRNKRNAPTQARSTFIFHGWIRDSLAQNKAYDQFARDILTAAGDLTEDPPVAWYRQVRDPQAALEDTAQLFMGMRLQCAQCHHHPFEKWSQQDYYGLAAFFTKVTRAPGSQPGEETVYVKRGAPTATNKKTKQPVQPAGLGASPVKLSPDDDPRRALTEWLTAPSNPYFARSLVNRYWKHFFGRGLVEPEDDMRETNPPANPELLEGLAAHFVKTGYNLKELVRVICQSRTYQLSAVPNAFNQADRQNFSRFYPKRLTAEVLLDAIDQVTGEDGKFEGLPPGTTAVRLPDNSFNASSYFLTVFGRPEASSACECERSQDASLAQSLHLLNSKEIQEKVSAKTGRAAAWASDTSQNDQARIRELYLWAYGRRPDDTELNLAGNHLYKKTSGAKDMTLARREAFEDLLWALINTKEFLFNH
ncbi:MAG: DUF1549 and DUF1553 domain-containing protein [Verrucomicrobiota bacterium]